jgi:hypothetical protein
VNHCNIHINFAAVGTHYEVYLELFLFQPNLYSHRDLVLYCGLRSIPEELVQVDVMQLAVHFFWFQSIFKVCKEVILKLQKPVQYHPLMSSTVNVTSALVAIFI